MNVHETQDEPGEAVERPWDEDTFEQPSMVMTMVDPGREHFSRASRAAVTVDGHDFPVG